MQPRTDGLAEGLKVGTHPSELQGLLLLPLQLLLLLAQQAQALFEPRAPGLQLVQGQRFGRIRIHQPLNPRFKGNGHGKGFFTQVEFKPIS
jgi:hypothetical protein